MKSKFSYWWVGGLVVLLLGLRIYVLSKAQSPSDYPRALFFDKTPLGGKGLHLLLNNQGYATKLQTAPLKTIPQDARVWLLLDPQAKLSKSDAKTLLQWVDNGGVLVWADLNSSSSEDDWWGGNQQENGQDYLRQKLHLSFTDVDSHFIDPDKSLLPILEPVQPPPGNYGAGVHNASISPNTFLINAAHQPLIGNKKRLRLALMEHGKGCIIISADALIFTNYALAQGDNAILVSNLIRQYAPHGAAIYFDERVAEVNAVPQELPHTLLYYLWRRPLRWAWLQLLLAGLLLWAFYGKRLGRPVPIPLQQPVTRASQFAVAMAALYQKARRPKVPLEVLGKEFRRILVRRTGASPMDSSAALAARCSEMTGLPRERIGKLLDQIQKPARSEADVLRLAQEMEEIQRKLGER